MSSGPPSSPSWSLPPSSNGAPVFRAAPRPPRTNWALHLALFVLTVGTTTLVGGFAYSFWLLAILTCHEFGHYFAARYHRVRASLPYFIPLPLEPLGTMGAVIRMSAYIPNRRALFDIGVAGPLAGIVVAVPVTFFGLMTARHVPRDALLGEQYGDPPLLRILEWFVLGPRPEGHDVLIGPMAFAGWVGMFVTALNLLPISQLDGGHISHAVFGPRSRKVAGVAFLALLGLMAFNGPHYILILALAWMVGLHHPPTMDDSVELDGKRKAVAAVALVVFLLCFTPTPVIVDWPPEFVKDWFAP